MIHELQGQYQSNLRGEDGFTEHRDDLISYGSELEQGNNRNHIKSLDQPRDGGYLIETMDHFSSSCCPDDDQEKLNLLTETKNPIETSHDFLESRNMSCPQKEQPMDFIVSKDDWYMCEGLK